MYQDYLEHNPGRLLVDYIHYVGVNIVAEEFGVSTAELRQRLNDEFNNRTKRSGNNTIVPKITGKNGCCGGGKVR